MEQLGETQEMEGLLEPTAGELGVETLQAETMMIETMEQLLEIQEMEELLEPTAGELVEPKQLERNEVFVTFYLLPVWK